MLMNVLIPAPNNTFINQLGKLSLRKQCPHEVHASKVPDLNLAKLEGIQHPLIL